MLGVCLGHQTIGAAFGGEVVRASEPMHGRTSPVFHEQAGVFADLPNPLQVCRYHSLIVERETLPIELEASAWLTDGTLMGVQHRGFPVYGVQFHPESILTESGYPLLANFLRLAGLKRPATLPKFQTEHYEPIEAERELPRVPVTF